MLVFPLSIWGLQQERRQDQERNQGVLHSNWERWAMYPQVTLRSKEAGEGRRCCYWEMLHLTTLRTDLSLQLFQTSAAEANFSESGCEITASMTTLCGNNNKVLPWVGKWLYFTVFAQQCKTVHCNTILPDVEGRIIVKECFLFFLGCFILMLP